MRNLNHAARRGKNPAERPSFESLVPMEDVAHLRELHRVRKLLTKAEEYVERADEYVRLTFHLESGKPRPYAYADAAALLAQSPSELPYSFRLTNIQRLDEPVLQACRSLEARLGAPVVCNLYVTPRAGKDCFLFHADHQDTYVCQLAGAKEWFFPYEEGADELLRHVASKVVPAMPKDARAERIVLTPSMQMRVPYGLVHRAECLGETPSVHLTFAALHPHVAEVAAAFHAELLAAASLAHMPVEKAEDADLEMLFARLARAANGLDAQALAAKFRGARARKSARIRESGRAYKD